MINVTLQLLYHWGRDPIPMVWESESAPGTIWVIAEILASLPPVFDSRDFTASSESLYRLRYFDPTSKHIRGLEL